MPGRRPISEFAGRLPVKKQMHEIPKHKVLDINTSLTFLTEKQYKQLNKQDSRLARHKLVLTHSFDYAKFEHGSNWDFIPNTPKALRLRYNKQLRIFVEKYGSFGDEILKKPTFISLFKKLPIEEKITYLDTLLTLGKFKDFIKKGKTRADVFAYKLLNKFVEEYEYRNKVNLLRKKYNNDANKIIPEVEILIKSKYQKSYDRYASELKHLAPIFKYMDQYYKLGVLETIYIYGFDDPTTQKLIKDLIDAKITQIDGFSYN